MRQGSRSGLSLLRHILSLRLWSSPNGPARAQTTWRIR
ncbi:unnamed protein product [Soboliphyme baturini]|uniref:Uncharacterized protein n=1 Tax=Soboliphyme baturini TaxID=241478 RepID=A0A183IK08_9BILA|nr:unnamed protein product [Soboliphyme baturini]